ncbi:phosphoadenylyl-sulfate reductase [Lichenifustis flavocetrariae]|uniref:Adenosine 5'-phosphosulfate reductase n=1 Tax=Lichenifustis flavocetrariae TaxID=2949735 RepID=A0AA41YWX1_9HYPH|nr:phosphoadenylyl-sulfate reductase [Lichenifustis flavocetrariae]MCW6510086.1 phosphoadenylyl-sulfate reductase [Lichenifustis flavocetrariae]
MGVLDVNLFGDLSAASRFEERFVALDASAVLRLAIKDLFPGRIALVSSFGADSAVLLHMISTIDTATPVIFVDSGHLFPETLAYRDELVALLGLTDVRTVSATPEELAALDPESFLWSSDPDRCCAIRKVAPLGRAIDGFDAWITGRKRFQADTRASLPLFETEGERVKINPLAGWDATKLLTYLDEHNLPRHRMVAKGYPSIGCIPCTSAVKPGEDARAGRWRGKGKVECGIHLGVVSGGAGI